MRILDDLIDEVDNAVDESVLDPVLLEVESLREDLINNFSDLGFAESDISSGAVDRKAYWSWCFIISSEDQCLECTIILYLDVDDCSRYSVEVVSHGGRAWATANTTTTANAATEAFGELKKLFELIAQETPNAG